MTNEEVDKLHNGDQVYWNDPDGGECSRHLTISSISREGDVVSITDVDGSTLECFSEELS